MSRPHHILPFTCMLLVHTTVAAAVAGVVTAPRPDSTAGAGPVAAGPLVDPAATALLARFKEATGGGAWDAVHATHTRGTVETGGLSGAFDVWDEIGTGRTAGRFALGPMAGGGGYDGVAPWSLDPSGEVTVERGPEALEEGRNEAYRTALAWWYPERWPAAMRLLAPRREDGRLFQRVEITPRGGRPFTLWLDNASALLERAVERGGLQTTTTSFADWRSVALPSPAGAAAPPRQVRLPFLVRSGNGEAKYDTVLRVATVELDPPLAADAFAVPTSRAADFALAGSAAAVTLPFSLRNHHVYVDVTVDGKGPLTMLFDSGGFNVVSPEAATRLGLAAEGALQGRGVGEQSEDVALSKVGELRLGGATLRDQVFYVMSLAGMREIEGVDVAGVIGFEVLKRFVVEVDYAQRRLTLTLPERFDPATAGVALPFVFADHMPVVEGSVDGIAGRFTIDTGSRSELSLHRPFVEQHRLVERYHPGEEVTTGYGVGGAVRAQMTRAGALRLGEVEVTAPLTELVTSEKGALADPYLAGNVGGGLLLRFRVTFDYRHERLYLAPGGDLGDEESPPAAGSDPVKKPP
ncbi:MAG TPA: pepsin/retropepsin-like aspartic protease family protein, partial [Thermoanaerobaculia bacterium]|nr:pepsin/retropepsin-like aspartic protease family protein [Thermoanaerobaculia bacterium]